MTNNGSMFNLSWDKFETSATKTFKDLLLDNNFTDVTLVCDDDMGLKLTKLFLVHQVFSLKEYFKNIPKIAL